MKLFQKLLVAPAALGLLAPAAVNASELNINGVSDYAATGEQVTSITQFSDIYPTDWAYQALSNLIERSAWPMPRPKPTGSWCCCLMNSRKRSTKRKSPLHDQSSLRRLEVPQSISGSRRALQAARITSKRCSGVLAPCRSNSSNTIGLIKPSCNSCWLVCDKPNAVMGFIVTIANHSPFILRTTPSVVNGPSHANLQG